MNMLLFWLRKKGIKQNELARLVGTSPQQINKLARATNRMSDVWAERLAPAMEIMPADLLGFGSVHVEILKDCGNIADSILNDQGIRATNQQYLELVAEIYNLIIREPAAVEDKYNISIPTHIRNIANESLEWERAGS